MTARPPRASSKPDGERPKPRGGEPVSFADLVRGVTQLLEPAAVTGVSLAVES